MHAKIYEYKITNKLNGCCMLMLHIFFAYFDNSVGLIS